jgi:hypothetical protein
VSGEYACFIVERSIRSVIWRDFPGYQMKYPGQISGEGAEAIFASWS